MLSFLFWNLDKRPLAERIAELAAWKSIDVIMLTECEIASGDMIAALNRKPDSKYCYPTSYSRKIQLFT